MVECGELLFLIDAGISAKQLVIRLRQVGIEPTQLNGVLLTHEHGDHVRGLRIFLKQFPIPVFATHATSRIVSQNYGGGAEQWKIFQAGQHFEVGEVRVDSFAIQHDAVDPVGFVIHHRGRRLGLLSDIGHVTKSVTERLRGLHALFVEANYDIALLEADEKRPWSIKQRISSRHGHLSNHQVGDLIQQISHPELSCIILGHLSSDCNAPHLAISHLRDRLDVLGHHGTGIHCAGHEEPTIWFHV